MPTPISLGVILDDTELAALMPHQKLEYWRDLAAFAKLATEAEKNTRRAVVAAYYDPALGDGTHNIDLGDGFKLKLVNSTNYKLDDNEKVDQALEQISRIGADGTFLADRLISWTPKLSVSEFKKLEATNAGHQQIKEVLQTILTTGPAMPTLEIVAPKV